jgi:hypothetical protein
MENPYGYRIIDEGVPSPKPPWNPVGLFLLTIWAFPPIVGAIWFAINWRRLGHHEKMWRSLLASLVALLLPFVGTMVAVRLGYVNQIKPYASNVFFLIEVGVGLLFLLAQRPIFDRHRARGGEAANSWWVLGMGIVLILIRWAEKR